MAAGINDKFNKVISGTTRPVATTLLAQKLSGATTASLTAATGWDTDTAVHGIMYRTDAGTGEKVAGSQIDWKATLSGTTLSNFTVTAGTDDTYAIGTTVELAPTAAWGDDMATGILVEHNQDGTHGAVTADTLVVDGTASLTGNLDVNDSSTAIRDSSDNELVKFVKTASAVNELTVTNAATGNAPSLSATGGDTNVDVRIVPKGTGYVKRGTTGGAIDWWEEIGRTTLSGAGDTITVSSLPARKYLKVLVHILSTGGTTSAVLTFNSDTGANYSRRLTNNDLQGTVTSQPGLNLVNTAAQTAFLDMQVINVSAQEKLLSGIITESSTAGAGTAPGSLYIAGKWANTSAQISSIVLTNAGTGDYAIGSEVIVLGHD